MMPLVRGLVHGQPGVGVEVDVDLALPFKLLLHGVEDDRRSTRPAHGQR